MDEHTSSMHRPVILILLSETSKKLCTFVSSNYFRSLADSSTIASAISQPYRRI